ENTAFIDEYRAARREVVGHSITQLQRATGEAVEALRDVATDTNAPAGARVSAARAILDTSMKAVELEDLAARVDAMGERLAAMGTDK
ncbi:hypothetical protein, partial [Pseudomonas sp. GW531-R1]|uniref:hypothetical protein n=1 Tax=Pseudomonas sp. GW531-R1 TaxID=2075556 RepID=UPI000CD38037